VAGVALSLDFWLLGQSLGGLTTGMATDPNTGPLFVLLALALFPNRSGVTSTVSTRPPVPGAGAIPVAAFPLASPVLGAAGATPVSPPGSRY
jgi:hypothetical protein